MSTVDSPTNPVTSAQVDPTGNALRISIRGLEYNNLPGNNAFNGGHYKAAAKTAVGLLASNSIQGILRYVGTGICVVQRVSVAAVVVAAVTAQEIDPVQLFIARAYTAADATNATSVAVAGNNNKARTSMGSAAALFTVASAVAGMSAGTKTVDANASAFLALPGPLAAVATQAGGDLYKWDKHGDHPLVLAQNEGILVQWGATAVATGTAYLQIGFEWAEVPSF